MVLHVLRSASAIVLVVVASLGWAAEFYLSDLRSDPERFLGLRVVIQGHIDYRSGATVKFMDKAGDGVTIELAEGRTKMKRADLERMFRLPEGKLDPPLRARLVVRVVESARTAYDLAYEELRLR
jgi:hypothetical protein